MQLAGTNARYATIAHNASTENHLDASTRSNVHPTKTKTKDQDVQSNLLGSTMVHLHR